MGTDSDTGAADCVQCPANTWRYVDPNDETTQTDGDCNSMSPEFSEIETKLFLLIFAKILETFWKFENGFTGMIY